MAKFLFAFGYDNLYFVLREAPFQEGKLKTEELEVDLNEIKDPNEKAILVATEPLTENENWQEINGLKVFKDGEEVKIK